MGVVVLENFKEFFKNDDGYRHIVNLLPIRGPERCAMMVGG
jgi:hypothetical protein